MLRAIVASLLIATPAAAEPRDRYEVLNDGPIPLAPLCLAVIYQPGMAWCIIQFERKAHAHWRLIGPRQSHILNIKGEPCDVTGIVDEDHKTTTRGLIRILFDQETCETGPGRTTHWIADDAPDNAVAVDARMPE